MKFTPNKVEKKSLFRGFLKQTSGNVAVIAGLAIIPIISVLGLALDFQLVVTKKNTIQQILDATLIAAARDRQTGTPQPEVISKAQSLFESLRAANDPTITCDPVQASFAADTENLSAVVDCRQPTTLSAIFGRENFNFRVNSGSTFGIGKIDVAFVFDLSGSMNCPANLQVGFDSQACAFGQDNGETRMDVLKEAAREAVDLLLQANGRPDSEIRIAMTGYTDAVNAGSFFDQVVEIPSNAQRRSPNLIGSENLANDYPDYIGKVQMETGNQRQFYDYESIFCPNGAINANNCRGSYQDFSGRFYYPLNGHPTCVWARQGPEAATDRPPNGNAFLRAARPVWDFTNNNQHNDDFNYGRKRSGFEEILRNEGSYRHNQSGGGQVTGSNSSTTGTFTTRGAIDVNSSRCAQNLEPVPLTTNPAPLENFINTMEPIGGTGGHAGTAWGWYLLSPQWASVWPTQSEPHEYDAPDTAKVLILMTDGEFNAEAPDVNRSSVEQTAAICSNIKAGTNITIFTVRLGTFTSSNLVGGQNITDFCATDTDRALISTGDSLVDDFRSIATQISDLRISS